jgi:hypothetical protein
MRTSLRRSWIDDDLQETTLALLPALSMSISLVLHLTGTDCIGGLVGLGSACICFPLLYDGNCYGSSKLLFLVLFLCTYHPYTRYG